jgi:hypothetical protein
MTGRRFYRARLVTGGPDVGVATWFGPPWVDGEEVDRSPRWQALVGIETTARAILMGDELPIEVDGIGLRNIEPIKEHQYRFLVATSDWATAHAPDRPEANPREPVDFHTLKPF